MAEIFNDYLDGIYFDGYAAQLATDNPQAYEFEFDLFLHNYN